MYRVDHKFKLPPNPDGSADWSNEYIYPNGWQSPSTSRVVVKEPDTAWNMHRLNQLYGGSNLLTCLLTVICLSSLVYLLG
ncbi:hypothetical protein H4R35_001186 [Dimargaris xerosporica]|nr:hypothetical protein H4R35_001186 [Dimargaris xerosporica]